MPLFQRSTSRKSKTKSRTNREFHQNISLKPGIDFASLYSTGRSKTGKNRKFQSTATWLPKPRKRLHKVESIASRVSPSVMARTQMHTASVPTRKSKTNRRRVDVPLGLSGVEMRLPALPRIAVGWRLVSLALAGILSLALYFAWTSPSFQVTGIDLMGLKIISANEVNALVGMTDKPIFAVDKKEIEDNIIEAFPEISAARVMIDLPNTVSITVTERTPVVAWSQDGSVMLVEADGTAFPQRNQAVTTMLVHVDAASAPPAPPPSSVHLLEAEDELAVLNSALAQPPQAVEEGPRQFTTPEMVSAIRAIAAKVPDGATVIYDDRHGLGWKDAGGWVVYLGDIQDIEMKLTLYAALLAQLDEEDIMPSMISLEQVDSPYFQESAKQAE